jgi:hypothetical protein
MPAFLDFAAIVLSVLLSIAVEKPPQFVLGVFEDSLAVGR